MFPPRNGARRARRSATQILIKRYEARRSGVHGGRFPMRPGASLFGMTETREGGAPRGGIRMYFSAPRGSAGGSRGPASVTSLASRSRSRVLSRSRGAEGGARGRVLVPPMPSRCRMASCDRSAQRCPQAPSAPFPRFEFRGPGLERGRLPWRSRSSRRHPLPEKGATREGSRL